MDRTVWKFALKTQDVQEVEMPVGAECLFVGEQGGWICLWCRVDPFATKEKRIIGIVGTGHPAPADDGRYIGSVILRGGDLVFHVFERAALSDPGAMQK